MDSKFLTVLIISFLWASIFNLCKESTNIQKNIYVNILNFVEKHWMSWLKFTYK